MDDLSLDLEKLLTLILFQVIERTALVKNLKIAGLAKSSPKRERYTLVRSTIRKEETVGS